MSTNSLSFAALEMLATINDANQFGWLKPVKSTICQTRSFVDGDVCATQAISVNYAAIPYKRTLNLMLRTCRTSQSRTLSPYSKWKSLLEWICYKTHPKRDFGPGNKENYKKPSADGEKITLLKCHPHPRVHFMTVAKTQNLAAASANLPVRSRVRS